MRAAACACALVVASLAPATAHAAITLRGVATTNSAANPGLSLIISAPAGLAAGDVMVATVVLRATGNTVTPPAGWTLIPNANTTVAAVVHQLSYVKTATAGDVAAGSFSFDLGGSSRAAGGIIAFSGVDTANPIDTAAGTASAAPGTTATAPAITTTNLRAEILVLTGWASNAAVSPDATTTERYEDASSNGTPTNNADVEASETTLNTPGSTGTFSVTGGNVRWTAQTIALNEAPALSATFPTGFAWPSLVPGVTATSSEQTVTVTSNRSWGVQITSDATNGRSRQWDGSAYRSLTLAGAMQWRTSSIGGVAQGTSFTSLSGSPATVVTGQAAAVGAVGVGVTFRQPVSYADEAALPAGNTYRQSISYTAQQGF